MILVSHSIYEFDGLSLTLFTYNVVVVVAREFPIGVQETPAQTQRRFSRCDLAYGTMMFQARQLARCLATGAE